MITKEIILRLHELSILKYGGSQGIRDEGLMESAIARPTKLLEAKIYTQLTLKKLLQ